MGAMVISISIAVMQLKTDRKERKQDRCMAIERCSPGRTATKRRLEISEIIVTIVLNLLLRG